MPLIFACIAPHGDEILPELQPKTIMETTRQTMLTLGSRLEALRPDTVIVLTPHGIRVENMISVSVSERAEGKLNEVVQVAFDVDQQLAGQIAANGEVVG